MTAQEQDNGWVAYLSPSGANGRYETRQVWSKEADDLVPEWRCVKCGFVTRKAQGTAGHWMMKHTDGGERARNRGLTRRKNNAERLQAVEPPAVEPPAVEDPVAKPVPEKEAAEPSPRVQTDVDPAEESSYALTTGVADDDLLMRIGGLIAEALAVRSAALVVENKKLAAENARLREHLAALAGLAMEVASEKGEKDE